MMHSHSGTKLPQSRKSKLFGLMFYTAIDNGFPVPSTNPFEMEEPQLLVETHRKLNIFCKLFRTIVFQRLLAHRTSFLQSAVLVLAYKTKNVENIIYLPF